MISTVKKTITFHCDTEEEMDSALDKVLKENSTFELTRQEKKVKVKKSKGEVIDSYFIYTVTIENPED